MAKKLYNTNFDLVFLEQALRQLESISEQDGNFCYTASLYTQAGNCFTLVNGMTRRQANEAVQRRENRILKDDCERDARQAQASPKKAPLAATILLNPEKPRQSKVKRAYTPGQIRRIKRSESNQNKSRGLPRLRYELHWVNSSYRAEVPYGYKFNGQPRKKPLKGQPKRYFQPDYQIRVYHKNVRVAAFTFEQQNTQCLGVYCSAGSDVRPEYQRKGVASRTYRWFEHTFHVYLVRGSTNDQSSALWDYLEGKRERRKDKSLTLNSGDNK